MTDKILKKMFDRWHDNLVAYAGTIIKNFHDAEDIVGDAYIKLYKCMNTPYDGPRNPDKMLFISVKNLCRDYLVNKNRHEKHHDNIKQFSDDFEDLSTATEVRAALLCAIAKLPRQQQAVVRMKFVDGFDNKRISKILGITVDTVRVNVFRSIRFLRVALT